MTTEKTEPGNAPEKGEEKNTAPPDQDQTPPDDDKAKKGTVIPYARFKEVVDKAKAAEEALASVVQAMTDDLPEEYQDLVPDLPPAQKVAWIQAAKAKGLFSEKQAADPAPELDKKRPTGKPPADLSKLNASQLLSMGYKQ